MSAALTGRSFGNTNNRLSSIVVQARISTVSVHPAMAIDTLSESTVGLGSMNSVAIGFSNAAY